MTKIKDIIKELEYFAPPQLQESWDNSGWQVGSSDNEVKGVLISVDVTEKVVDEASELGANLILSHHPLIFKGLKRLTGENDVERAVLKAIKNDIAIYCMHTNLDVVNKGVSYKMAERLGLRNLKTLQADVVKMKKLVTFVPTNHLEQVRQALFSVGAGRIGQYDSCGFSVEGTGSFRALEGSQPFVGEKNQLHFEQEQRFECVFPDYLTHQIVSTLKGNHPYEEVAYDIISLDLYHPEFGLGMIGEWESPIPIKDALMKVKEDFNLKSFRHSPLCCNEVKKIAVCGGSCSFLIEKARSLADMIITADVKYHEFFNAENKIVIADIGHFESEQFSKEIFYDIITKKFNNFAVYFSSINTNPINFI